VRKKQIFAPIISVFEEKEYSVDFICRLIGIEIQNSVEEETLFRANSLATIVLDSYLKNSRRRSTTNYTS